MAVPQISPMNLSDFNRNVGNMLGDFDKYLGTSNPNLSSIPVPQTDFSNIKLGGSGFDAKSLALGALDFLDRPRSAIVNPLADLAKNGWANSHLGQDIWSGLNGTQHAHVADILNNIPALKNDPNKWQWNDFVREPLGFLGDMALDPLTYLTFGAGSVAKAGLGAGLKVAGDLAKEQGMAKAAARGLTGSDAESFANGITDSLNLNKKNFRTDVGNLAAQNVRDSYSHIDPYLIDHDIVNLGATNKGNMVNQEIQNAEMAARNTSQNRLFNFDVPFTNITKGFGTKPGFLQIQAPKIGELGASAVSEALRKAGLGDDLHNSFINQAYNVAHPSEMTTQQLNHFLDNIGKVKNDPVISGSQTMQFNNVPGVNSGKTMNFQTPTTKLNQMLDQAMTHGMTFEPPLQNGKHLAQWFADHFPQLGNKQDFMQIPYKDLRTWAEQEAPNLKLAKADEHAQSMGTSLNDLLNGNVPFKGLKDTVAEHQLRYAAGILGNAGLKPASRKVGEMVDNAAPKIKPMDRLKANFDQFVADSGGSSKMFQKIKEGNPFNARTLRTADPFLNDQANAIQNAYGKIQGGQRQMAHDMADAKFAVKDLTPTEKQAIPYFIQKAFPGGKTAQEWATENGVDLAKVEAASAPFQRIFATLGQKDVTAGTVPGLRENYFPHVTNISPDKMEEMLRKYGDDPELQALMGRSSKNAFGQKREGYQTLAQVDNYVADLAEKAAKETDPELKAALEQKAKDIGELFKRDPVEALGDRYRASIRSNAMAELQKTFKDRGLIRDSGKGGANFERLDGTTASQLGLKEGQYIHKDILNGIKKSDEIFTDKGMNKFLDTANSITSIWKSVVTTYSPSHHLNNLIGDTFTNMAAGVKLGDYRQAGRILKGKNMSQFDKDIYQKAMDSGVLGQSWMSELSGGFKDGERNGLQKFQDFLQQNKVTEGIHKVADPMNNFTRLALFAHGLKVTGSQEKAAEMVRKYLFNYREQTTADRAMRSVIPFWSWMKNNLPMQIQNFARQPRYAQAWNRLRTQLNGGSNDNMPGWAQNDYVKLPGTDNSYWNPRLPVQDLNNVNPVSNMIGGLNPLLKVPIELQMNKQFFNGAPIDPKEGKTGSYDPAMIGKYLLNQTGVAGKAVGGFDSTSDTPMLDYLSKILTGKIQHF